MASVSLASINPLAGANLPSLGSLGSILLIFFIAVMIVVLLAGYIYFNSQKKKYYIKIHAFRLVGNVPTRVSIRCATEIPFGMAGDKMWRVAPNSFFSRPFKIIKWLPVGKIQTGLNEYWYYIREDGEWVNFKLSDLNEVSRVMGVKFVQEDMRLQRLATERLLEQRLMDKTFWEKWGTIIMTLIFFLVISVCMVIIFYQFSKIIDKMMPILTKQDTIMEVMIRQCGAEFVNTTASNPQSLIPV